MSGTPLLVTLPPPPIDRREILRYARSGQEDAAAAALLDELLPIAEPTLTYRAVFREVSLAVTGDTVTLGPLTVTSHALAECLSGAERALLTAATVGMGIDRLLLRYGQRSPARALLLQAIGTERVEALMEAFTREREREYGALTRRFSPGYGDLPLAIQSELLPLLDAERLLGITLTGSLLMAPRKSVTAIIGIKG